MAFQELENWTSELRSGGHLCQAVLRNKTKMLAVLHLSDSHQSADLKFPTNAKPNTLGDSLVSINREVLKDAEDSRDKCKNMGFIFDQVYSGLNWDAFKCTESGGGVDAIGVTSNITFMDMGGGLWPSLSALAQSLACALEASITPIEHT